MGLALSPQVQDPRRRLLNQLAARVRGEARVGVEGAEGAGAGESPAGEGGGAGGVGLAEEEIWWELGGAEEEQ